MNLKIILAASLAAVLFTALVTHPQYQAQPDVGIVAKLPVVKEPQPIVPRPMPTFPKRNAAGPIRMPAPYPVPSQPMLA
jgi:hypothetical protein